MNMNRRELLVGAAASPIMAGAPAPEPAPFVDLESILRDYRAQGVQEFYLTGIAWGRTFATHRLFGWKAEDAANPHGPFNQLIGSDDRCMYVMNDDPEYLFGCQLTCLHAKIEKVKEGGRIGYSKPKPLGYSPDEYRQALLEKMRPGDWCVVFEDDIGVEFYSARPKVNEVFTAPEGHLAIWLTLESCRDLLGKV